MERNKSKKFLKALFTGLSSLLIVLLITGNGFCK